MLINTLENAELTLSDKFPNSPKMMIERSQDYKLSFQNLNVFINKTQILKNVSGEVHSKELLAVMGPSGSGKTTMLNAIAGREAIKSGEVKINNQRINKQLRRKLGYVLQQDLFFSNLTLWETLYFTAMLNIPESIPHSEKLRRIDLIIETLDLEKCRKTTIGGEFGHGLSGGEKKRLSIACELLNNPDIMLLDEPTSGLDSSTAFSLMVQLKQYAETANKAIIVTIHQPSSQIYHMFTTLLLLADGNVAYSGKAGEALTFFEGINLVCEPHYNPADFLLEIVKRDESTLKKILHSWENKSSMKEDNKEKLLNEANEDPDNFEGSSVGSITDDITLQYIKILDPEDTKDVVTNESLVTGSRWQSSFYTQLRMLAWRNFKQSKSRILSKYVIGSSIVVALCLGLMWFQIERSYQTIRDRMGWAFFIIVYWGFSPIIDAVISFPLEKTIMMKERAAGSYRLSAYYLAKTFSEIPLMATLPVVFVSVTYWMAGMKGPVEFIATVFIICISAINSQGFGFVIGAGILDFQLAMTCSTTFMLCSLTFGGFYSQKFPPWLLWIRYFSLLHYPFGAISLLEFSDTTPIPCANVTTIEFHQCAINGTEEVTAKMILEDALITLPLHCYISTLLIMTVFIRILGYFILRIRTKQKHL